MSQLHWHRGPDEPAGVTVESGATGPPYRSYYIYCDEASTQGGAKHFGWGSLWIPSNRTGDIGGSAKEIGLGGLMERRGVDQEVKWTSIAQANASFFCDLVDWFFSRQWIMFHALVVASADVDWARYSNRSEGRVRFLFELLNAKVREYSSSAEKRLFRVRVDPLPIDYDKEHEKLEKITNAVLRQQIGKTPITSIKAVADSKRSAGVQICDVLLGALLWSWNDGDSTTNRGKARLRVANKIAAHLGWPDLKGATRRPAWKFNSWYFMPKEQAVRRVVARDVPTRFAAIPRPRPARGRNS